MIDWVNLGGSAALFHSFHLPFFDHMHCFVACQRASCRIKGKETQTRLCAAFNETMILLNQIIQEYDLPQFTRWRLILSVFTAFG